MRDTTDQLEAETELVHRVRDGDSKAFGALLDLHLEPIKAFVTTRLSEPSLVNEITQDTFVFAFQNIDSFEPGTSFSRWVRAIAWNLVRRELQRFAREQKNRSRYLEHCLTQIDSPHACDTELDELGYLQECIDALPENQRKVLELCYWNGFSSKEVGKDLGQTENWVRTCLFRIRKQLRRCIERKNHSSR